MNNFIKLIIGIILITFISGCQLHQKPIIKTVYKDKYIPVYITPKPPKVKKPELDIFSLTKEQRKQIGSLVKAYKISLTQEMHYACILSGIIAKYDELSAEVPPLLNTNPPSYLIPKIENCDFHETK